MQTRPSLLSLITATSFLKGKEIAKICFLWSFVHRYTCGTGASFVHKAEDFDELLTRGFKASHIHEVLIDKALLGERIRARIASTRMIMS